MNMFEFCSHKYISFPNISQGIHSFSCLVLLFGFVVVGFVCICLFLLLQWYNNNNKNKIVAIIIVISTQNFFGPCVTTQYKWIISSLYYVHQYTNFISKPLNTKQKIITNIKEKIDVLVWWSGSFLKQIQVLRMQKAFLKLLAKL